MTTTTHKRREREQPADFAHERTHARKRNLLFPLPPPRTWLVPAAAATSRSRKHSLAVAAAFLSLTPCLCWNKSSRVRSVSFRPGWWVAIGCDGKVWVSCHDESCHFVSSHVCVLGGVRGREQVAADGGALPHGPSREAQDGSDTFRAHSRDLGGGARSFFSPVSDTTTQARNAIQRAQQQQKNEETAVSGSGECREHQATRRASNACCCDASRCETELYLHGNLEASANPCGLLGRQDGLRKSRQHNAPKNEHKVSNSPAVVTVPPLCYKAYTNITHRERTRSSTRKQNSAVCYKATVEPRDRNR